MPVLHLFPDRADASRRLGGRGREEPSVGTSATGHGLHLSARETGLTGTYSGESLEDGAERGEGSRHFERSMHARLDQTKYFCLGRVEPSSRIYDSLSAIAKLRYIHVAAVAKIGHSSISAFTRPGRHLIGWEDRF